MKAKDINIRIEQGTYRKLKVSAAKRGLSIKRFIGVLAAQK